MRARMFAMISTAWVVPSLFGPGLAGIITDHVGWRWVFLGLVPFTFCAALITLPALRKLALVPARGRDWPRTGASLALAGGSGCLVTGLGNEGGLWATVLILLGLALVVLGLKQLMPAGTLVLRAGPPASIALYALASLAFFGVDSFVPLLMTTARNQSATVSGLTVTAASLMWSIGSWLHIGVVQRLGRRRLVQLGSVMMIFSVAGVGALFWPSWPIPAGFLAWGLGGLGMGMIHSAMNLSVLESAEKGREGEASSSVQLAQILGVAFGAGIGGAVLRHLSGGGQVSARALGFQFALMVLILLVVITNARRVPEPVSHS
jgi:MFS family permease